MFETHILPRLDREKSALACIRDSKIPHALARGDFTRLSALASDALVCQGRIADMESLKTAPESRVASYLAAL